MYILVGPGEEREKFSDYAAAYWAGVNRYGLGNFYIIINQ